MPAQVIIKLIPDTSEMPRAEEAVASLAGVDKETADQIKATNKAFQDRAKATQTATSSTDKLSDAAKKLAESIAGGAINQAAKNIDEIGNKSKEASAEAVLFAKTIEAAKQKLTQLSTGSSEFDKLSTEIAASELAMANMADEATSARGKLRQYRETLLQLEDAGLDGTQVFEDLAVAAGELSDQVGDTQNRIKVLASDTFKFDVAIQAVEGVTGAFSVAQGAAALLGSENEDLQKALLKVNAAMSILQGLQSIQNILQKESALSIGATIALQKIAVVQTNLQAAAESRNIIVRYAAIAAQRALNFVMAANPAGVVLFAIAALATGLYALTRNTDDAAAAQARLNEQLKFGAELNDEFVKSIQDAGALRQAQLKAQNATEAQLGTARLANLQSQLVQQKIIYDRANANYAKVNEKFIALGKDASKEDAENRQNAYDLANKAAEDYFNIQKQLEIEGINQQQTIRDQAFSDATALAQARISQAKKDSKAEIQARIDAIRVGQAEQLATQALTDAQKTKLIADNQRAISDLTLQIQEKGFDDQIALAKSKALEEQDFLKRLSLDIAVVELQAQRDRLGKNAAEAQLIETQKNEAIRALRQNLFKELEKIEVTEFGRSLSRQHAFDKAVIREQVLTSAQLAQARLQARQQENQAALDNKEKRLQEEKELRYRLKETALNTASSIAGSLNEIARNQSDKELSIVQDRENEKLKALQQALDQGAISQEEYNQKSQAIQAEYDRKSRAIKIRAAQQEKQLALFQAGIAQSLAILAVLKDQAIPLAAKPIFIGLAIAQALAQLAAIASKPIPAFKTGTKNAPGGMSLIGEAGPELYYADGKWGYAASPTVLDLPKGSKVIPTLETEKILNKYDIPLPKIPSYMESHYNNKIDYRMLAKHVGREVGSQLEKLPLSIHGYDKDGPWQHITTVQNRHQFLSKRFGRRRNR
jgi:hypothetical protein